MGTMGFVCCWLILRLRYAHGERGLALIEWIGLAAVVMVLMGVLYLYFHSAGGAAITQAVAARFRQQVQLYDY